MQVTLTGEVEQLLTDVMQRGKYTSPDLAIHAALLLLNEAISGGDFAPGELDKLLEEGLRDLEQGNFHDGEEVFEELRKMSEARRAKSE